MTENKYASFKIRFIASLLDFAVSVLLWSFGAIYIANQPTLPKAVSAAFVVILIVFNPIMMFSSILFTHFLGGTPGKLMTGLRVVGENEKPLSFKRILFRQTIGYSFSWILFGLGYFAIIKDPKKQAWHDKTVGSVVTAKNNLFVIGLALFFVILTAAGSLFSTAFSTISDGPLGKEAEELGERIEVENEAIKRARDEEQRRKMDQEFDIFLTPTMNKDFDEI
jgi:uncharacterized RDD family membrane protein YckC